ncbi:hypothetical protein [Dyadobacter jiangsuensis]
MAEIIFQKQAASRPHFTIIDLCKHHKAVCNNEYLLIDFANTFFVPDTISILGIKTWVMRFTFALLFFLFSFRGRNPHIGKDQSEQAWYSILSTTFMLIHCAFAEQQDV